MIWRRILIGIGVILVGVVALIGATVAVLQTSFGRDMALGAIERAASGDGSTLEFDGANGGFPLNLSFDEIRLSDADGMWLRLEDVVVTGRTLALLLLRVRIDEASAGRVHVLRSPESNGAGGGGLPRIALPIEIVRLEAREIVLDAPMLGQAAVLSADGALDGWISAAGLSVRLDLARLDRPGQMALDAAIRPRPWRIDARFEAAETADGLVQTALDLPRRDAYALSARISGELDDLTGDLTLDFAGNRVLEGIGRVSGSAAERQATATVAGNLNGVVPDWLAPYLGGDLDLDINARIAADEAITFDIARLTGPGIEADATGRLSLGRGSDDLEVEARLGEIGRQGDADDSDSAMPFAGPIRRADVFATVATSGGRSTVTMHAGIADVGLDIFAARQGNITLRAWGNRPGLVASTRFDTAFQGELAGAAAQALDLVAWFGDRVRFSATGNHHTDRGPVIEEARAASRALSLAFSGTATPDRLRGDIAADIDTEAGPVGPILAGSGQVAAAVDYTTSSGRFDLDLDAALAGLDTDGFRGADLFDGDVVLTGAIRRQDDGGFRFNGIDLTSDGLVLTADGDLAPDRIDLSLDGAVRRLDVLEPGVTGSMTFQAQASGTVPEPRLDLVATGEEVTLMQRPLAEPRLVIDAGLIEGAPTGTLAFTGRLDDQPVDVSVDASSDRSALRIDRLSAQIASASAGGALVWPVGGAPDGTLDIDIPDLSVIGPFLLTDLSGRLAGRVDFAEIDGLPGLTFDAQAETVRYDTISVGRAELRGRVRDLLGARLANGRGVLTSVDLGGQTIETATLSAQAQDAGTSVSVEATLSDATVSGNGLVTASETALTVALGAARIETRGVVASLAEPTELRLVGGVTQVRDARFAVGGGSVEIDGTAGETLDLQAVARQVPLRVAAPFVPGIEPRGTLRADVTVSGPAEAPEADWNIRLSEASVSATRELDLPGFRVTGSGRLRGQDLTLDIETTAGDQMALRTRGSVTLDERTRLALRVDGTAALALSRRALRGSGIRLGGRARVDLRVDGTAERPVVAGSIQPRNASARLTDAGVSISDIGGTITLDGRRAQLDPLTGVLAPQGNLRVTGQVDYANRNGPVVDLAVRLREARFQHEDLVTARLGADLTARGATERDLLIAGTVDVQRADITVPDGPVGLSGGDTSPRRPSQGRGQREGGGATPARLDVTVNAPRRVFVQGRGLDAEMGGSLRLTGPVDEPAPNGAFEMRRGHLDFLGQRLDFERGDVTFDGNYDPLLDMLAGRDTNRARVTVAVQGRASSPGFRINSEPPLGLDEQLALLLFGRPVDRLSTRQIAQLADAVAQLGGAPSILGRLNSIADQLGLGDNNRNNDNNTEDQDQQPANPLLDLGTELFRNLQ
ncbi:MAG: translocation/assembly module TamB domain-containing protein [Pseudomonadota bacterium]